MAIRLSGAVLLVLTGCWAAAWWSTGSDDYTKKYLFVPSVATQGYSQTYGANMEGAIAPVQQPYTSGFLAPRQEASGHRSIAVPMLCGLVGAAVGIRVATAAVSPPLPPSARRDRGSTRRGEPVMQLFQRKTPEEVLEEKGYWPGEWVCADCGYLYAPGTSPAFEELRQGWKCPQCAGPRRRFVKKAGGVVATLDDSPLILGTVASAVVITILVVLGLTL
jgi:rubredoxin